jgi:hypothetical protein
MRKSIPPPVRKENFTTNGVTSCHFVTSSNGEHNLQQRRAGIESVTRRYNPEPAALTQLVEVLHELLLTDASGAGESTSVAARRADFSLLPCQHGVSNVSPAIPAEGR